MRTVSTLCASGTGIGLSALGLSLVTNSDSARSDFTPPSQTSTRTPSRDMSLTTTAVFTFSANSASSPTYRLSTPSDYRVRQSLSSPVQSTLHERPLPRSASENAALTLKSPLPHTKLERSLTSHPVSGRSGRRRSFAAIEEANAAEKPVSTRRPWLRRLSNSMSSRESSRTPSSRPTSAAVSHSNGSVAYSNAPSTAPLFPVENSTNLPPNKLVKRSSSVRSFSAHSNSASRLPRPTFKRPATSHQRSSLVSKRSADIEERDRVTTYHTDLEPPVTPWRHYFVPRVSAAAVLSGRKRGSSIPNPIKRVFPDRRYRPILVSAREPVARMMVEADDGFSSTDGSLVDLGPVLADGVASSPIPTTNPGQEQAAIGRRSFSIGDLLTTGPQPLWRLTSSNRGRIIRRSRRRISSGSHSDMGSMLSVADTTDSDRPKKRREVFRADTPPDQPSGTVDQDVWMQTDVRGPYQRRLSEQLRQSRSSSRDARKSHSSPMLDISPRPTRASTNTSVLTDGDIRSYSDSLTDYQSDRVFDSIPTRTTRSSSGRRGPAIDTIFDNAPVANSSHKSTKLKDYLQQDTLATVEINHRYSTIQEEDSISTPVRSSRGDSMTSSPAARSANRTVFSSSPPMMQAMPDGDNVNWDAFDDDATMEGPSTPSTMFTAQFQRLPLRFAPVLKHSDISPATSTPLRNGAGHASVFDWSEAQPSPSNNQSPPRPRTVHGKKDADNRSSRTTTRRTPSTLHSRSHSVPVVPDGEGKRDVGHNKFGTWGVGSKAVTEDWDEDFDFDDREPESEQSAQTLDTNLEKRIDSGHDMLIPSTIREQQQNIMANIGLLREWGLLIEELKELRVRAVALQMLDGPYAQAWSEVDAMIELADQESEEHTLEPRRSPPSSPGFDYSAFEAALPEPAFGGIESTLPEPLLNFSPLPVPHQASRTSPTRPRKGSEAVARSVIAALQQKRSVSDAAASEPVASAGKVPFDTATLRHIVPYVSNLRAKVKEALRETEGLYKSPVRMRQDASRASRAGEGSPISRPEEQDDDDHEDNT